MIIDRYLARHGCRPRGIVHVGAHRGGELGAYLALRPQRIVWVEADPDLVQGLRATAASARGDTEQVVIHALITDRDGDETAFRRYTNDGGSSSVFASTELLRSRFPGVEETGEVLTLRSRRLDSVLREAGLEPADVDVLVFDVQGAELMALRGAGEYLDAAAFIESEISTEEIYRGAPLAPELEAFLASAGFERVTTLPWHGDAVYKRAGLQVRRSPAGTAKVLARDVPRVVRRLALLGSRGGRAVRARLRSSA
jgi:FkbM family methyltransferase